MSSSPQAIDLGEQMMAQSVSQAAKLSVTAPVEASTTTTSDLKTAVEEIRSATILVELSLNPNEPVFHYISPVWEEVVGLDPVTCLGIPISSLLFPSDARLFGEATKQLLADDSHTVEVRFRLRIHFEDADTSASNDVYEAMEGKGMLVHDRETGKSTHTMCVFCVFSVMPPHSHQVGDTASRAGYSFNSSPLWSS
jgi:serine/threonine-protein kinase RIM15